MAWKHYILFQSRHSFRLRYKMLCKIKCKYKNWVLKTLLFLNYGLFQSNFGTISIERYKTTVLYAKLLSEFTAKTIYFTEKNPGPHKEIHHTNNPIQTLPNTSLEIKINSASRPKRTFFRKFNSISFIS